MSVVQSKRGEGQLLVLSKANELSVYTIKICAKEGYMTREQVDACFTSWKAHAEQGDTYNLVRKMTTFYQELWR